eukprot:SAG31_NODE_715_length_12634_cov_5.289190_5_plen_72_part_00
MYRSTQLYIGHPIIGYLVTYCSRYLNLNLVIPCSAHTAVADLNLNDLPRPRVGGTDTAAFSLPLKFKFSIY